MLRLVSWNASQTFVRPVHIWNRRHIRSVRFNMAESTYVIRSPHVRADPMLPPTDTGDERYGGNRASEGQTSLAERARGDLSSCGSYNRPVAVDLTEKSSVND